MIGMVSRLPEAPAGEQVLLMQVPAQRSALGPAQQRLTAFLASHGVGAKALYASELVLEELLANVIHQADLTGIDPSIEVRADLQPQRGAVVLQVSDSGPAFDPTAHADPVLPVSIDAARPGGLGLMLVRRWSDGIAYQRDGGRNRVTVSLNDPRGESGPST